MRRCYLDLAPLAIWMILATFIPNFSFLASSFQPCHVSNYVTGKNRISFVHSRQPSLLVSKQPPSLVDDDFEYEGEQPSYEPIGGVDLEEAELPTFSEEEYKALTEYDENDYPVEGQPWRRGITDGAEDPIDAPWRVEAERIIQDTVESIGGKCKGITWFMNKCVVTLVPESLSNVLIDPEPDTEVIWVEDGYEARTDFDWQDKSNVAEDEWLIPEEEEEKEPILRHGVKVFASGDGREEEDYAMEDEDSPSFDGRAIATLGKYITDALSEVDDRLNILNRCEILFAFPGDNPVELEIQADFDSNKGKEIMVTTIDPFNSNRTLQGKLVGRDALDVKIIDANGGVVTIPLNFVHQVFLAV
jgi:hypothetical protein